jgi:hypothetical protein
MSFKASDLQCSRFSYKIIYIPKILQYVFGTKRALKISGFLKECNRTLTLPERNKLSSKVLKF